MAPLLRVGDLQTHYTSFGGARVVKAVDGISFTLREGETIGIVGESGCGKTTTCLSIVGLLPPAARIVGGSIEFNGEELTTKRPREMRRIRGLQIAMILQDPMASLNPLFRIFWQVAEPAYHHRGIRGRPLRQRVQELLRAVRIASPAARMREFPHQMSGGMRQRVVGAIAMAGEPKLYVMYDAAKPEAGRLYFTEAEWDAFVLGVKDGEFDLNEEGNLPPVPENQRAADQQER